MELAETASTMRHEALAGAPSPVKLRQTYSRDVFADVPNLSIETATKCLRIGSFGVAIGPHCVANLYKGACNK